MHAHQTTIYGTVVIISLLTAIIIAGFATMVFRKQRKFSEIQRQRLLAEVLLLEKERSRISRDLHDETGSQLQVTILYLNLALTEKGSITKYLEMAHEQAKEAVKGLGRISKNLTPKVLERNGLQAAVNNFLANYKELPAMDICFEYLIQSSMAPQTSLHLFRILQELVQNALKHSGGTQLLVRFGEKRRHFFLICKDNGKGFDIKGHYKGLGLGHLQNRTAMLGGRMTCTSTIEKGTEYYLVIPKNKII